MAAIPKHTQGIVLRRINYAENDRIVTFLTRDFGKVRVIAKGTRKEKSRLAGGIELFSVSDIGFVVGRGELATLVSSRLAKYYGNFLKDLSRIDFAYNCLKSINKITADGADKQYFLLLEQLLIALNNLDLSLVVISVWWYCQLAKLTGHNINTDYPIDSKVFNENIKYNFDIERGGFKESEQGEFNSNHIKYTRLAANNDPRILAKITGGEQLANDMQPKIRGFIEYVY
ncbi:MAG TPA: DNA repair protein RecO [Patescibacteria group bacterium]|nr:DNA repair protein RecO [Patescibacteria group bacterium]